MQDAGAPYLMRSRTAILNVTVQAFAYACKFLLLLGLARLLPVREVGEYGLITVTIGILLYLFGLDFYVYSSRLMVAESNEGKARVIRNQFALYFANYLFVLPLATVVFFFDILEGKYLGILCALAVLEHLCQEIYRILVMLSRPLSATGILLLRNGIWVVPTLLLMHSIDTWRTLDTVLYVWLAFDVVALLLGIHLLRFLDWKSARTGAIDWQWIKRGIRVSLPFLAATFALRTVTSFDRYSIERFWGTEVVGIYTLYAGLANAIPLLLETAVFMLAYPAIIAAYQRGDHAAHAGLTRAMARRTLIVLLPALVAATLLIFPLLRLIGRPVYAQNINTYWVLLAASTLSTMAMIPHTVLYAQGRDKEIIAVTFAGCVGAVVLNLALVPVLKDLGAALATLGGFGLIFAFKSVYARGALAPGSQTLAEHHPGYSE